MNVFGKSKSLPQQPPQLPPKWIGAATDRVLDTPGEDDDDDDDDMYEPPPNNTQDWRKFPLPRPLADSNVYSGRSDSCPGRTPYLHSSKPVKLPGMHSITCRMDSHPGSSSSSRTTDVLGKQATPTDRRFSLPCPVPQTPPRRPPKPSSSSTSDDLYLVPILEQGGSMEDIYLKCDASPGNSAPTPSTPGLNLKAAPPAPVPTRPLPNPRAPAAATPRTRPQKSTPAPLPRLPTPNTRMPLTLALKPANKPKPSQPGFRPEPFTTVAARGARLTPIQAIKLPDVAPERNRSPVLDPAPTGATEDLGLSSKPWYGGHCDRNKAETMLQQTRKDGAFMVRKSSGQNCSQPYTLVVLYRGRVYNIPIRSAEGGRQYTLGKEGKNHEELFSSLASMIQHYQDVPLVLIGNSSSSKEQTCLHCPVRP